MFDLGYCSSWPIMNDLKLEEPNLRTGVGHGHYRGPDKVEANHKKKCKKRRSICKQSRRRNARR